MVVGTDVRSAEGAQVGLGLGIFVGWQESKTVGDLDGAIVGLTEGI